MSLTKNEICCLIANSEICMSDIGYEIVLKENKGYETSSLYNKLNLLENLTQMLRDKIPTIGLKVKNNIICFSGKKVLLSKNNSLFLDNIDSQKCKELELEEDCCTDVCDIESRIKSICKNC